MAMFRERSGLAPSDATYVVSDSDRVDHPIRQEEGRPMLAPRTLMALAAWSLASRAAACTLCHSDVGLAVRDQVLGTDLFPNLAGLAAPLPLLAASVLLVRRMLR